MGRDKAALNQAGEPLVRRVVARLQEALPQVLVIGPDTLRPLVPGVRVIPDREPGLGPLGGLVTALHATTTPWVFLAGCDMPFIAPLLVREMVRLAMESPSTQVVLLRTATGHHYLHAIYAASCLPAAERLLASGERSLHALVDALAVREVPPELVERYDPRGLSVYNVNTPAEWERARELDAT